MKDEATLKCTFSPFFVEKPTTAPQWSPVISKASFTKSLSFHVENCVKGLSE